jgi:CHAD domain-containing protein
MGSGMKKNKMKSIVRKRFKKMHSLLDKLPIYFQADDIHRLRVEIKKLRAFLQFLASQQGGKKQIQFPERLRKLYGMAGILRNLQLEIKTATDLNTGDKPAMTSYLSSLEAGLEREKSVTRLHLPSAIQLAYEENILIGLLPDSITKSKVRKFMRSRRKKIAAVADGVLRYEQYHRLRKLLKTIQYNKKALFSVQHDYNPALVEEITDLLGGYCDACNALSDFQLYSKTLLEPEKRPLLNLQKTLIREKNKRLRELKHRLPSLRLIFSRYSPVPESLA